MVRFARYWDLIGNSGRFPKTLPLLLSGNAFENFMALSDWLFKTTAQTHKIALSKLFTLLHEHMLDVQLQDANLVETALLEDFKHNRLKGVPKFKGASALNLANHKHTAAQRQRRHVSG